MNSVDVSATRVNTKVEDEDEKISKATCTFVFGINSLVTLGKFQTVEIWEADSGTVELDANKIFSGHIAEYEKSRDGVKLTCFSEEWRAIQTEVNQTFDINIDTEAGKGSEIFKTLATAAGLSYDSSSVEDTGTVLLIKKFVCPRAEVMERMQTLAAIYGYQIYYRADTDLIYFQTKGFESNTNILYVGGTNNNVMTVSKWKFDSKKIFNRVEIIGAFTLVDQTESFNGDASKLRFTLEQVPDSVRVTVGGTEQIGGTEGSTETFDYTVDKSNKEIVFQTGSIPGAGSGNVVVVNTYKVPISVIRTNQSSVADIGRTIKARFTFNDIESVDDAESRGDNLLEIYSDDFKSATLNVSPLVANSFEIRVGQKIRVIDDRNSIDSSFIITRKITRFPETSIEIEIGDKQARLATYQYDTATRLKRLEEELSRGGEIVVEIIDLAKTLVVKRKNFTLSKFDYDSAADYSIWGLRDADGFHDWGSGKWGTNTDAFEAEETVIDTTYS